VVVLKALWHLDTVPLIVGIGVAVVVAILLPIVAPALLGMIGFGALGPIAGKSTRCPTRDVITES